jgi:hypothetical protein
MKGWLDSIILRIKEGSLLPAKYYAELDIDAALNARDTNEQFSAAWNKLYHQVDVLWRNAEARTALQTSVEAVRRESFIRVSQHTHQHEIASYVSDDLDLIARAKVVGVTDPFLEQLWNIYKKGEFPAPQTPAEGKACPTV